MSFAWFAYAAACVMLIGLFFQTPRLSLGAVGLAAVLLQQALGTVAAVMVFASVGQGADGNQLALSVFRNGFVAWLLWSPLIFLIPPLVLAGSRWRKLAWIVGGVGTLPNLALVAASAVKPDLVLTAIMHPVTGELAAYYPTTFASVCLLLTFTGFAVSVALLALEALTTPAPMRRAQFALMACALALEGAYHASNTSVKLFVGGDFLGAGAAALSDKVVTGVAALAFAAIAVAMGVASVRAPHAQQRRWARAILACVIVAAVTGAAAAPLVSGEEFRHPSGLFHAAWDLTGLCLLVFAALRYQLFDIEMKARRAMTVGSALVIAFVAFRSIENVAENFFQESFFGGLPAAGTIAAIFVAVMGAFIVRVGNLIAQKALPNVSRTLNYEAQRHEELYAAALEGAFLDGILSPAEANSVKRLREKLGITDAEHARIEARVRASMAASAPPTTGAAPA